MRSSIASWSARRACTLTTVSPQPMSAEPDHATRDQVGELALDEVLARGAVPREEQCDEARHDQEDPGSHGRAGRPFAHGGTLLRSPHEAGDDASCCPQAAAAAATGAGAAHLGQVAGCGHPVAGQPHAVGVRDGRAVAAMSCRAGRRRRSTPAPPPAGCQRGALPPPVERRRRGWPRSGRRRRRGARPSACPSRPARGSPRRARASDRSAVKRSTNAAVVEVGDDVRVALAEQRGRRRAAQPSGRLGS